MARDDAVDIEAVLAQPLVTRVAAPGPTVRPVWFLWDAGTVWWMTDKTS